MDQSTSCYIKSFYLFRRRIEIHFLLIPISLIIFLSLTSIFISVSLFSAYQLLSPQIYSVNIPCGFLVGFFLIFLFPFLFCLVSFLLRIIFDQLGRKIDHLTNELGMNGLIRFFRKQIDGVRLKKNSSCTRN